MNELPLEEQVRILKSKLSHMQTVNKQLRTVLVKERMRNNMDLQRLSADNKYLLACQRADVPIPRRVTFKDYLKGVLRKGVLYEQ